MFMRIFSIIAITLYSASACAMISDLVMCFGTDGHVLIEQASAGSCDPALGKVADETTCFSSSDLTTDHCGSCQDVPLIADDSEKAISVKTNSLLSCQPFATSNTGFYFGSTRNTPQLTSRIAQPVDTDTTGFGSSLLLI